MDELEFIQTLVDLSLCYGLKSPDMDLYDFGFGDAANSTNLRKGKKEACTHILHVTCRFKVIWKKDDRRIDIYHEDTPYEKFDSEVQHIVGLKVKQVALSDKNDLWLDFGDCWVVFATFENGKESWRFFVSGTNSPHLIASGSWLHFSG